MSMSTIGLIGKAATTTAHAIRRENVISANLFRMMGDDGGCPLVRSDSVLIADNILWSGKVVQPIAHNDRHTQAVMEFNRMVREDPRVENVIVPLRDGLNLIRIK